MAYSPGLTDLDGLSSRCPTCATIGAMNLQQSVEFFVGGLLRLAARQGSRRRVRQRVPQPLVRRIDRRSHEFVVAGVGLLAISGVSWYLVLATPR